MPKIGILAFLIVITISSFLHDVLPQCAVETGQCYDMDAMILANTAPAPFRYRVLSPAIMGIIAQPDNHGAWFSASLTVHLICFMVIYVALYMWLRPIIGDGRALAALAIMALLSAFAFHFYYLTPSSIIEVALLCLTLVSWRRFGVMLVLVVIGSLNRESALLLVAVYAVLSGWNKRNTAILFAVWGVITAALHLVLGSAPHVMGLMGTLQVNIDNLAQSLVIAAFIAPLWIMALTNFRRADWLYKQLALVALIYMGAVLVGGRWLEIGRMGLPAAVLVMPLVLSEGLKKPQPPIRAPD